MSETEPSREEIAVLARHAGLALPPAYLAELADAYVHVRRMIARLPRSRPHGDEPAHVFDPLRFASGEG